jgi:hypothetical protein
VRSSRLPALGALAGVLVGLAVAGLTVGSGSLDDRVVAKPAPDASEEFIAAFQRSLEGTYFVRAVFTRVLSDGRTLTSNASVAQRPPDSLRRQFGGLTGTIGGRQVVCSTEGGGPFHCAPGVDAPDHATVISQDVANLRSYFVAPALYQAVRAGPDCFELTQLRPSAVLPYGSFARFCFDPDTGAIRLLRQDVEGATDTFEATLVRGEVTEQDFSLDDDAEYREQTDPGPNGTAPEPTDDTAPTGGTDTTDTTVAAPGGGTPSSTTA